jgi:hypothetical protein
MSLESLYTQIDEIELENSYNRACSQEMYNIDDYWLVATDEQKYIAYIAVYNHYFKNDPDASFEHFMNKIKTKLNSLHHVPYYTISYPDAFLNADAIYETAIEDVEAGTKTWLQGLMSLYSVHDLEVYGL